MRLHNVHPGCLKVLLLWLVVYCGLVVSLKQERFIEELRIDILADGNVRSHFQFDIERIFGENDFTFGNHYHLFPKAIGHIIQEFKVQEFHLTFTQGRWQHSKWGAPISASPTGVELYAWFEAENAIILDDRWQKLTHALSGLFCASLQYLDVHSTAEPLHSFFSQASNSTSIFGDIANKSEYLRYGALPRETVCTENHTPWMKLLPCREQAGLGYLMNPLKIYDTHFHAMGIHVVKYTNRVELSQMLTVVANNKLPEWTFSSHFGRQKQIFACPLADESKIVVHNIDDATTLSPHPTLYDRVNNIATYNLSEIQTIQEITIPKYKQVHTDQPSPLITTRHLTGYGQERGGILITIHSNASDTMNATYFDTFPWYIRIYFHTLKITLDDRIKDLISLPCLNLRPAELRGKPSIIEVCVQIPPGSTYKLYMEYEKSFLHYSEYPPDAHRGFDISAGVVTSYVNSTYSRVYTENILLSLPTPDFSMLYNVITMTSTVFALFFGSIFNLLVRRLKDTFTGTDFVSDRPIAKLYRRVAQLISKKKT